MATVERPTVLLIDYGVGNLHSARKALERVGARVLQSRNPADLERVDGAVLPGVGAFGAGMERLRRFGWDRALVRYAARGRPLLGICLGMQLLFQEGEEMGRHRGLGIFPGRVVRIPEGAGKLPHMGWNRLRFRRPDPLLVGLPAESYAYFVHSYAAAPEDPELVIAAVRYGADLPAVVGRGRVWGTQFHPEKSGPVGLRILRNFVDLVAGREPEGPPPLPTEGGEEGLARRILPCLDVKDGRVVKGIRFLNLRDVGDPVEQARAYDAEGADELVFLDISASAEGRATMLEVVRRVAAQIFIPLTVGGGIGSEVQVRRALLAGADKVSINTAAVRDPSLIERAARRFGSQCVVLAVDARRRGEGWEVVTHGGRRPTGLDVLEWVREGVRRGAGEILLTSMDADGTLEGYDLELTRAVAEAVPVPVIASGGAGTTEHFARVLTEGRADAALAASLFHDRRLRIGDLKAYLAARGIPVRPGPPKEEG